MKLYLLRHADAGDPMDPRFYDDTRRPLSSKGDKRTRQLANAFRQMGISFDAIFTSPYVRARQTAELVARSLKIEKRLRTTDHLLPGREFEDILLEMEKVCPSAKTVLLVGHEPFLSGLVSWLCTGGSMLSIQIKKGGLCRLELEATGSGRHATLEWLLTSRHFGSRRSMSSE